MDVLDNIMQFADCTECSPPQFHPLCLLLLRYICCRCIRLQILDLRPKQQSFDSNLHFMREASQSAFFYIESNSTFFSNTSIKTFHCSIIICSIITHEISNSIHKFKFFGDCMDDFGDIFAVMVAVEFSNCNQCRLDFVVVVSPMCSDSDHGFVVGRCPKVELKVDSRLRA